MKADARAQNVKLADGLRAWRKARGLRQQDVADYLEVWRSAVSRWERGETPVPQMARLALHQWDVLHPDRVPR